MIVHPVFVPGQAPLPQGQRAGADLRALDRTASACVDFYQFACGGWMKANPIPPDQSRWGRFNELAERNRETLRQILEKAARPNQTRDAPTQKIGDYYASCMSAKDRDAAGASPLRPDLDRISAINTGNDLLKTVARLHQVGVDALFEFGAATDLHDSTRFTANLEQGGLGMPDRDNYLKDDPKSVEVRDKYRAHVARMFELLGDSRDAARNEAGVVLDIETSLARASMDRTMRRDPKNRDHKMSRQEASSLAPDLHLPTYFEATATPPFGSVNVSSPDFFKQVGGFVRTVPLQSWKTYLRWHLVHGVAGALSTPFVNEDFAFYGKTLRGQQELEARWKRCVRATDADLGEALGQPYVARTFGSEGKRRTLQMVHNLERAMGVDIRELPWMSTETKERAIEKLNAIAENIGYPDKWRDYAALRVVRGDFAGNRMRAEALGIERDWRKIEQPVDRKEWAMTPPTVNAYAQQGRVTINFPAGILQAPFFDRDRDEAVNYGAIGAVIGHEMTHLFDDQGAKFDVHGSLNDWWTEKDAKEFDTRTGCIADQYSQYVAVDDVHLNGRLTLGENTADNGGVKIAYLALMEVLRSEPRDSIDGFTPEQRFFLGYAQIWCQNQTDEVSRLLAQTDPHAPGKNRVNGVVSNSEQFQQAFGCRTGDPMVRENACRVW